jgi:hypothetical protein
MLVRRIRSYFRLQLCVSKNVGGPCSVSSVALIDAFSTPNCGPPLSLVELLYSPPMISQCVLNVRFAKSGGVRISHQDVESPLTSLGSAKLHFSLIHPPDQGNRCSICRMRPRIREFDDTPDISPNISNAEIESRKFSSCI